MFAAWERQVWPWVKDSTGQETGEPGSWVPESGAGTRETREVLKCELWLLSEIAWIMQTPPDISVMAHILFSTTQGLQSH